MLGLIYAFEFPDASFLSISYKERTKKEGKIQAQSIAFAF